MKSSRSSTAASWVPCHPKKDKRWCVCSHASTITTPQGSTRPALPAHGNDRAFPYLVRANQMSSCPIIAGSLLACQLIFATTLAQPTPHFIERLTTEEGLSSNTI